MPRYFLMLLAAIVAFSSPAFAKCGRELSTMSIDELPLMTAAPAAGDYGAACDTSTNKIKKFPVGATPHILTTLSSTEVLTRAGHANRTLVMSNATAATYTLPAATGTGDELKFVVGSANVQKYTIAAPASTYLKGGVFVHTDNGSDAAVEFNHQSAGGDSYITLNATTLGGKNVGDEITFTDIGSGVYAYKGFLTGSGSEINPSSSAAQ